MVGRYGPQVTRQAASPEDCRAAALTIVVDIEETPRARLTALNQVAVDPIGQCACQQLLDSRRTVEPGSTTEVVDDCGSEHANTLLSRENTTCQGSVSSAKKGIR